VTVASRPAQIFIVSGPSGSGKTTMVEHLLKAVPGLMFSVSYTTRAPRAGEQDGREYRFISRPQFEQMLARDEFLEHASVFGDYYGTARSAVAEAEKQGKDLLLDIDVQGARQVKSRQADAIAILLLPPSWQELERRLRGRGADSPEIMKKRLERAREEIESYATYDFIVVNRDLQASCALLEDIVNAERLRHAARPVPPEVGGRAAAARRDANKSQISAILETFGTQTP
jgi:guanylate kinase